MEILFPLFGIESAKVQVSCVFRARYPRGTRESLLRESGSHRARLYIIASADAKFSDRAQKDCAFAKECEVIVCDLNALCAANLMNFSMALAAQSNQIL
jgi:hypothetical protein